MLTLTIYNAISDEDIIKGRNIAGTGTISAVPYILLLCMPFIAFNKGFANWGSWTRTSDVGVKVLCLNHLAIPHYHKTQNLFQTFRILSKICIKNCCMCLIIFYY